MEKFIFDSSSTSNAEQIREFLRPSCHQHRRHKATNSHKEHTNGQQQCQLHNAQKGAQLEIGESRHSFRSLLLLLMMFNESCNEFKIVHCWKKMKKRTTNGSGWIEWIFSKKKKQSDELLNWCLYLWSARAVSSSRCQKPRLNNSITFWKEKDEKKRGTTLLLLMMPHKLVTVCVTEAGRLVWHSFFAF